MIIDLPRFIETERPSWTELERMLDRMQSTHNHTPTLEEAKRFHFLYQKVSADLARIATFASEPELRRYLESLVARAYGEIHETRSRSRSSARCTGSRWNSRACSAGRWARAGFPRGWNMGYAFGTAHQPNHR